MASKLEQNGTNNKELESDDSDWSEIEHDGYGEVECLCLFCELETESTNQILSHIAQQHGVNLQEFIESHKLGFYDVIKMINCVRANSFSVEELVSSQPPYAWADDKYYSAFLKDDPLLTYDFGAP